jgi:hypothetical protein
VSKAGNITRGRRKKQPLLDLTEEEEEEEIEAYMTTHLLTSKKL